MHEIEADDTLSDFYPCLCEVKVTLQISEPGDDNTISVKTQNNCWGSSLACLEPVRMIGDTSETLTFAT
jgi:hypothetical protein